MDQSYHDVSHLIQELVDFRKRAPQDISDTYARNNKEILRCLNEAKIDLSQDESTNYLVPDNPFENINIKNQLDGKLPDKMYKQIQLLDVLCRNKDCKISKIIDEM